MFHKTSVNAQPSNPPFFEKGVPHCKNMLFQMFVVSVCVFYLFISLLIGGYPPPPIGQSWPKKVQNESCRFVFCSPVGTTRPKNTHTHNPQPNKPTIHETYVTDHFILTLMLVPCCTNLNLLIPMTIDYVSVFVFSTFLYAMFICAPHFPKPFSFWLFTFVFFVFPYVRWCFDPLPLPPCAILVPFVIDFNPIVIRFCYQYHFPFIGPAECTRRVPVT